MEISVKFPERKVGYGYIYPTINEIMKGIKAEERKQLIRLHKDYENNKDFIKTLVQNMEYIWTVIFNTTMKGYNFDTPLTKE